MITSTLLLHEHTTERFTNNCFISLLKKPSYFSTVSKRITLQMNCLGTPQHKNSNITSRSTSETVALLLKLPTVPPRLLSYHSWIISPPLRPSCVILLRLQASTLLWLPQTNSRYFSINPNADYLCAGDFLEEYLKEQLHY